LADPSDRAPLPEAASTRRPESASRSSASPGG
jgi:hypothetical protein